MIGSGWGFDQRMSLGILYFVLVAVGCSGSDKDLVNVVNAPPTILSVTATPDTVAVGENSIIVCRAVDEENDPLTFAWSAEVGSFQGSRSDSTIVWNPPVGLEGLVTLTVVAKDRTRESAPASVDLLIVGETGSLTGTVVDRSNNVPLASALVSVGTRTTETNPEGVYSFASLPVGTQSLSVAIEGYTTFSRTIEIRLGENSLDVTLTAATSVGAVAGRITNSLGSPLEGATCRIGDRIATSAVDGTYRMEEILRQTHILQVTRPGYLFSSQSIVLDSEELAVDVTLDATSPTFPSSVVAEKNGETITITWPASAEDTVTEYQVYQRVDRETTTAIPGARVSSSNRRYVLTGEANRRYRFRISAINFEAEESTVSAESNMVVLIPLTDQVPIPAGPVVIGATPGGWVGEDWGTEDHPANAIEVGAFSIDVSEVTNHQYRAYVYEARSTAAVSIETEDGNNGVYADGTQLLNFNASKLGHDDVTGEFTIVPGFEDHPIVGVSWYGAKAYADHFGLRLPSEVEWEKAARGTSTESGTYPKTNVGYGTLYPWGNEAPQLSLANFDNLASGTLSVRTLEEGATIHWSAPIYHMAGNVSEWCEDWLGLYQAPHAPPSMGDRKVLRGGSWSDDDSQLRNGARPSWDPVVGSPSFGFRCVTDGR